MLSGEQLAVGHLVLRLRPLHRALTRACAQRAELGARVAAPEASPPCVTHDDVAALLDDVEDLLDHPGISVGAPPVADGEREAERELRAQAAARGAALPLDRLAAALGLDAFDEEALLLCFAPDLDAAYGTIYGYLLDDLTRRAASVELCAALTASSLVEKLARRAALGPWGRLRRLGLVVASGGAGGELREELRVSSAARHVLCGGAGDPASLFFDPAEVDAPPGVSPPAGVDAAELARVAAALARGDVTAVGVFGPPAADVAGGVRALASAAGLGLRRGRAADAAELAAAAALGAALWVESPGELEALPPGAVPVIVSGAHAVRPARLLETRAYAELHLAAPAISERLEAWRAALPELDDARARDLAARFRLAAPDVRAVADVARTRARLLTNGHAVTPGETLDEACAIVTRRRSQTFATFVPARRTASDLVLPAELHARVVQIASFHRALATVDETWGFGRRGTGGAGVKALFTGESGTGKTLAAEVVAGLLGLPLMRVDLARVVSKWVGETEKNLEVAFREAEESHAVLFFDEADALFGSRAEVRHGTDRYANLEVSYLLQRLEQHVGVVVLASNLRDHIDVAFTRRFDVVISFPRPAAAERGRLWRLALGTGAPVADDVDLAALTRLDLTGAGIVAVARTAALLAAHEGAAAIAMPHLVRAVAQQYHREARVVPMADLGPHAGLLRGSA
jgi:hypothetical protein